MAKQQVGPTCVHIVNRRMDDVIFCQCGVFVLSISGSEGSLASWESFTVASLWEKLAAAEKRKRQWWGPLMYSYADTLFFSSFWFTSSDYGFLCNK